VKFDVIVSKTILFGYMIIAILIIVFIVYTIYCLRIETIMK